MYVAGCFDYCLGVFFAFEMFCYEPCIIRLCIHCHCYVLGACLKQRDH